jgi:defect-in-organelle-trafficking protein DotC
VSIVKCQWLIAALICGMVTVSGCQSLIRIPAGGTDSLHDLEDLNYVGSRRAAAKISEVRLQALRETAMSIGARAALSARAKELNADLTNQERNLDRIFNFEGLVLDHHVMPPVLEEASSTLNLESGDAIRISDHTYRIVSQARFVTAAPHWREYLWMNFEKPPTPDKSLLPRNKKEKVVWKDYVKQGWKTGIAQADLIYSENVERLRRDYQGMVLYRKLLTANMISRPFVAKTDMGVTGDSDEIRIHDQVLRITAKPMLDPNSKNWKPVLAR